MGGTGFIGYHLAKKCIKIGWQVTSISSKSPPKKRRLRKVKYIISDITKKNILKKRVNNYYNYIVNLGGYVDHLNKNKTFKSHYIGCKNLTEIFFNKKPLAFVQMGSSGEYGRSKSPQHENSKCNPQLIYGQAKLLASKYLIKIFKKKKFPVIVLRLYQAYGPKQDLNRLIPIVINACIKNKKFPCSDGKQARDFLYIDDVVNANILAATSDKSLGGEVFNVAGGNCISNNEMLDMLKSKVGSYRLLLAPTRVGDVKKTEADLTKIGRVLGYEPSVTFEQGLNNTLKWWELTDGR